MQWLIDLIKEWVTAQLDILKAWIIAQGYLTTSYIYRGTTDAYDYALTDFTRNGAWHELDLFRIVPPEAKAVDITVQLAAVTAMRNARFRKAGEPAAFNMSQQYTQAAYISLFMNCTVPTKDGSKIEYWFEAEPWVYINFVVKGWWL